jgi:superfamily II DNA or RNA helicase
VTTLKLRPYQQAAIDAVRENWRVGKNRVVLVAPVGAGKTACAEGMIQRALEAME